ncbi:MAG: SH3 domain-containing protein [Anaerolineae bacterium]|nr:SH3 domain-containing protein [Anaerolineae bacterium]
MKNKALTGLLLWLIVGLVLITSACTPASTPVSQQPTRPIAIIASPRSDTQIAVGQEVMITFTVADVKGVAQVELAVDGQPIHVEKVTTPVNSFAGNKAWTPDKPGSHVIELRAFNVDNEPSDPAQVFVTVTGAGGETPPPASDTLPVTPVAGDTPPAGVGAEATPITLIPPTPTAAPAGPSPAPNQPSVTTRTGLNVRGGPGTDYPVIGRLTEGQTLPVTGRNAQTTWWQVVYPPGSSERGWVSGDAQFTTSSNTEGVPIVQAPPRPTPAPPTATPTPALPVIQYFRADRETLNPGEKVTLSWDLSGAREAFLRYDDVTEGVIAPGSKTLSPSKTTVYTLLARGAAGDTTAQVTVKMNEATATPVTVINDGKSKILNGQTIDFDRGVIQGSDGAGADFFWDGQEKRFMPQNGAAGAFVGDVFEEISLNDCRSVTYGQPFPDVGSVSRITGCYRTDQGRYGKFFISEWSADASLTMQWVTWDFR